VIRIQEQIQAIGWMIPVEPGDGEVRIPLTVMEGAGEWPFELARAKVAVTGLSTRCVVSRVAECVKNDKPCFLALQAKN